MKMSEKTKRACKEILSAMNGGQCPTDPIITWDGNLHLTSKIYSLNSDEVILMEGFDGFGDIATFHNYNHVFEFILDFCEPWKADIDVDLEWGEGRWDNEVSLSVESAVSTIDGISMSWDDYHSIIETLYNQIRVGKLGSNDDESWIWTTPDERDSNCYRTSHSLTITGYTNCGFVEQKISFENI